MGLQAVHGALDPAKPARLAWLVPRVRASWYCRARPTATMYYAGAIKGGGPGGGSPGGGNPCGGGAGGGGPGGGGPGAGGITCG